MYRIITAIESVGVYVFILNVSMSMTKGKNGMKRKKVNKICIFVEQFIKHEPLISI